MALLLLCGGNRFALSRSALIRKALIRRPFRLSPLFFTVLVVFAGNLNGQLNRFEGKQIVAIEYSPPLGLDQADENRFQPLKTGETLREEDVARAIDLLFSTGEFADIAVDAEPRGAGVAIRFITRPQWFVGGVNIEGETKDPPNGGQLHSNARFTLGAPFVEDDVTGAVDNIGRLLKSNGLYEAQVTPRIDREDNGEQVFITFNIEAGKRAKYEQPVITNQGGTPTSALLPNDTILRVTGWRLPVIHWWRRVTDSRTRKGVLGLENKYQKQDRLTVKVQLEQLDYDAATRRVKPRLTVDPGPKLKVTAVEAKVSNRVLKRYVPVFDERTVDTDLLVEGKRNLEDYFQSKGYYDVDIDFRVRRPENDLETIEYVISKGERHKVVSVVIAGNKYFDTQTIRERMFIEPTSFTIPHGRYSEAFRRKDEANITELYKSNGFRDVEVATAVADDYKGKHGDVAVTLTITEGPQWRVDKVEITGFVQLKQADIARDLASAPGQPFAEVNLATDRDAILTRYFERGFPSATFKASWQPAEAPDRVNVRYEINEGSRQFVRRVITSGNRVTRESLIQKNITLKPGDPLSPVEETEIQKRFYDLGVFARVDTAVQNPDGATDYKYVLYNFEEANRYTLNMGVGAQITRLGAPSSTSLGSPSGTTGFSPGFSLDISRLNFLGVGNTVSLRSVYSEIEKRVALTYLEPRFMNNAGRNISYTVLYDSSFDVRTFASKRAEASVQVSQKFSKSLTGLFRIAYRRVSVSDVIIPVLLIPQLVQPVRIGIVSANLVQDRRNNAVNPSRGMYNTLDLGLADKIFGSERNFARALVRNATYYRLSKNLIFARQTQFGVIAPFDAPQGLSAEASVPLPERFFSGGADSLRAFPFNQAGPRDTGAAVTPGGPTSEATGFPLGGNAVFFNNLELRFPLLGENIQGVIFHDMGNVFSSLSSVSFRYSQGNLQDFNYTVHDVGLGVRYRTPVGPMRLDLAYGLHPPAVVGCGGTPVQLLQCNPNANPATQPSYCIPSHQSINHIQFFFSIGQTF